MKIGTKRSIYCYLKSILVLFLLASCADPTFTARKNKEEKFIPTSPKNTSFQCAQFTLVKPPVDFLFLWDNSSSTTFINPQTKSSLNNLINNVSERFDYQILMAPLIANGNQNAFFVSNNSTAPSGVPKVDKTLAANRLDSFPSVSVTREAGLTRVYELLEINKPKGVFRNEAYLIIVIMSNEDDNSYIQGAFDNHVDRQNYLNARKKELLCFRGNTSGNCAGIPTVNSRMMRFLSIVPHTDALCASNAAITQYKLNYLYKTMSGEVFSAPFTNGTPSPAQLVGVSSATPDSFDICLGNFANLFDQVNSVIQEVVIAHQYKYWPVTGPENTVNPDTIVVTRNDGTSFSPIPDSVIITEDLNGTNDTDQNGNKVTGWRYLDGVQTLYTRFLPSIGEPYTGRLVQLFGDAKVKYPACLKITSFEQPDYFGFVKLDSKPLESSIELKINNQIIPPSSTNGWQLVKSGGQPQYFASKNIQIKAPDDRSPVTPGVIETGYFLEVFGTAVYTNGDKVEVTFLPTGN